MPRDVSVYASIGARLVNFALDVEAARLERRGEIVLPSRVRFARPHPTLPVLYAACGDGEAAPGETPYHLCALARDEAGDLSFLGDPVVVPAKPMEVSTDLAGACLLTTYNNDAPGLGMHAIERDGRIGAEVPRVEPFDFGKGAHDAVALPSNTHGVLTALGKKGFGTDKYVAGALKLFRFGDGRLENVASITPPDADATGGFNPRNVAVHPGLPLLFVSAESQHKLCVFRLDGDAVDPDPPFVRDTLVDPGNVRKRQDLGAVLVHPRGHVAYLANRNDGYVGDRTTPYWRTPDPIPVWPGGENNIAVFTLDPQTGEPTRAQNIDTLGIHPRTLALDPSGRVLLVNNYAPTKFAEDDGIVDVPASIVLYRVADDGTLTFAHQHGIDVAGEKLWWMGVADRQDNPAQ